MSLPHPQWWIIGVVISCAMFAFFMLLALGRALSRRRQVEHHRNPSRTESGLNRNRTNIIQ